MEGENLINTSDELELDMGMEPELVEVDSEVNFIIEAGRRKVAERERACPEVIDDARPGCSYHENPQQVTA